MSMPRSEATAPPSAAPCSLTFRPSSPPRSSKASRNVTKPTAPRITAIADADSRMVDARSAERSVELALFCATGMRGSWRVMAVATP